MKRISDYFRSDKDSLSSPKKTKLEPIATLNIGVEEEVLQVKKHEHIATLNIGGVGEVLQVKEHETIATLNIGVEEEVLQVKKHEHIATLNIGGVGEVLQVKEHDSIVALNISGEEGLEEVLPSKEQEPIADQTDPSTMWELSLYELHRSPEEPITDNTEIEVSPRSLQSELTCPICLDILKKTMAAKECLHRFCSDCIVTALRSGNKECPTCRKKLVSKRSLRPDPNFDLLISKIYPDRDEYEAQQTRIMEKLNKSHSRANLVQSINEGIKLQTQNRQQRTKKYKHEEQNESSSSTTLKHSNNSSQDNVTRTMVQTKGAKNIQSIMISEKEGPASIVDTTDITECDDSLKGVDELELVFKPLPIEMASDNQLIKVLKENSVRYIKTTANATVDHLSKYLAMRLTVDLGTELPEQALNFSIYVAPTADLFVPLQGNQTLRNVHDKYWKVNKPLEMFYSFN